jgi:O-methyltransferase involved in polyketide biosynthesis
MVTSEQAENLLLPLLVRAHAVRAWPQVGFVDQAAEYLVRKLELDQPEWRAGYRFTAQHQLELTRCKWIDKQVVDFLKAYPDAMGIELGSGLSTRFQRLSATADWPRFSWVDVDDADVIDCADLIFPSTDNYRLVACDLVRDDWLKKTGWRSPQPLIVIIETLPPGTCLRELKNILAPLLNVVANNVAPVHLIFDYASPALQRIRKQLGCMLYGKSCCSFADAQDLMQQLDLQGRVLNEQDLAADDQGPLVHRLLARLYRRFTRKYLWGAVHLRLDATRPSDQLPERV